MAEMIKKKIADGTEVVLVPRKQLRQRPGMKRFTRPAPRFAAAPARAPIPTPPAALDNGEGIDFPMDGNDRVGDCFYVYLINQILLWLGRNGDPHQFSVDEIIRRYENLSGGDRGLDWSDIEPEFMGGVIGPHGPYRAVGLAALDPNNVSDMRDAIYQHGGVALTLALPDDWIRNHSRPGGVWDAGRGVTANQQNGHAVLLSGFDASTWCVRTWHIDPPIRLTHAGMRICDPEAAVFCGLPWFNAQHVAPNGFSYNDLAAWWAAFGGDPLPPLSPTPTPGPVGPAQLTVTLSGVIQAGEITLQGTASEGADQEQHKAGGEGRKPDPMLDALSPLIDLARERGLTPDQLQAIIAAIMALLQAFLPK